MTIAEYGERWLRESASRLKVRTLWSYTGLFRLHVAPAFAQMKVAQLHRSHVKRLLVDKHELGLSKDTIRLVRATISAICRRYRRWCGPDQSGDASSKRESLGALAQERHSATLRAGTERLSDDSTESGLSILRILPVVRARVLGPGEARRSKGPT